MIHVNLIKLQIWSPDRLRFERDTTIDRINADVFFSVRYQPILLGVRGGIRLLILGSIRGYAPSQSLRGRAPRQQSGCDAQISV